MASIRPAVWLIILFFIVNCAGLLAIAPKVMPKGINIKNDIRYIWEDGNDIARGVNPYAKIHGSDMRNNQKYSTYFPGFFISVAVMIKFGVETFADFLYYWRGLSLLIHLSVGTALFAIGLSYGSLWGGLLGGLFFLYNRFTLSVMGSGQIDLLAIGILVWSLYLAEKKQDKRWSPVLFGLSLAIKQLAIFLVPIYIFLQRGSGNLRSQVQHMVSASLRVAAIPVAVSIPFLMLDAEALLKSVFFSATRNPGGHIRLKSVDHLLGMVGFEAKFLMLFLFGCILILAWQRKVTFFTSALLVFAVFVGFNSVILWQYFCWMLPFIPLCMYVTRGSERNG